jgi:hypothetical protein
MSVMRTWLLVNFLQLAGSVDEHPVGALGSCGAYPAVVPGACS